MYLHKINIENIRSIKKFILEFKPDECAGWHVLIGDNGTGKSTLVRAIALALAGAREAEALRQNWMDWLRNGESDGCITTDIKMDPKLDETAAEYIHPNLWFQRKESRNGAIVTISPHELKQNAVGEYDWREDTTGFCASYGPFRRFTGGNKELEKLFCSKPRLAPHLSIFGEEAALTECLEWLQILHVKQLENRIDGKILDDLRAFINKGRLLPHGVVLEKVTSDAVVFRDGSGCMLSVEQLSDGYRSILSMTFDLIRQLVRVYPAEEVFQHIRQGEMKIDLPGIVLVDEIDAHLHPAWQRRVGSWFCRYFPKIQFIVTTHSPLICQAAETGTVWRLPAPGSDLPGGRVTGMEFQRLVYGNILDALDTELFGENVTRSDSSKKMLQRLATLNNKSFDGELPPNEHEELQSLRAILPTARNMAATNNEMAP